MSAIVYQITNLVNGKRYIGITSKTLARRKAQHTYEGRRGKRGKIYAAMRLYGVDLFRFHTLKICSSVEDAKAEEIRLIATWKPQYNIAAGGEGAFGRKAVRAVVERIAAKQQGRPAHNKGGTHTEAAKEKMRAWRAAHPEFKTNLGKRHPGMGAKIAAALKANGTASMFWKGKKRDAATKEKISRSKIGVPRTPPPPHILDIFKDNMRRASLARRRPVFCVTDGMTHESITAAAKFYGADKGAVWNVLNGIKISTRGRRFEYAVPP